MAGEKKGLKEVAVEKKRGTVEESFGSKPPIISVGGGEMHTFGYKPNPGIWNKNVVSCDQKTGFPENYDRGKKAPKV